LKLSKADRASFRRNQARTQANNAWVPVKIVAETEEVAA
jgi:hypothetical protein